MKKGLSLALMLVIIYIVYLVIGCSASKPKIIIYQPDAPGNSTSRDDSLRTIKMKEGFVGIIKNPYQLWEVLIEFPTSMVKGSNPFFENRIVLKPGGSATIYANPSDLHIDKWASGWPVQFTIRKGRGMPVERWRTHFQPIDSDPGTVGAEIYLNPEEREKFDWFWIVDYYDDMFKQQVIR